MQKTTTVKKNRSVRPGLTKIGGNSKRNSIWSAKDISRQGFLKKRGLITTFKNMVMAETNK